MGLFLYVITMLPQDRIYSEYKKAFKELPHPPGTEFIADYNAFGVLDKTRVMYKEDFAQGCDYRVGEVRVYSGSRENIEAFYAAQTVDIRGEEASPGLLFIPMGPGGEIDPYDLTRDESTAWDPAGFDILDNLKRDQHYLNMEPPASYYYVGIGGFSISDNDIRCQF